MKLVLTALAALTIAAPARAASDMCWLVSLKDDGVGIKAVFGKEHSADITKADGRYLIYDRNSTTGLYEERDGRTKAVRADLDGIRLVMHDEGNLSGSPEDTCTFDVETDHGKIGLMLRATTVFVDQSVHINSRQEFVLPDPK